MQRTILYILGTSFSGSSLLNSLFDVQPLTRGLGEAVHLSHKPTNAWCSHCRCHVDDCRLQRNIDPQRFYQSIFDFYPDTRVLINSSKHWGQCFRYMPIPAEEYKIKLIVLSKSLVQFASSFSAHQNCGFQESFEVWIDFYQHLLRNIDGVCNGQPLTDVQQELTNRLDDRDVVFVSYEELANHTDATMHRICDQLGLPFNADYRKNLWQGDSCTIGGNNAIYAQTSGNASFFGDDSDYLGGKYAGRQGSIFYDNSFRDNHELLAAADQFRESRQDDLDTLCCRLRQSGRLVSKWA